MSENSCDSRPLNYMTLNYMTLNAGVCGCVNSAGADYSLGAQKKVFPPDVSLLYESLHIQYILFLSSPLSECYVTFFDLNTVSACFLVLLQAAHSLGPRITTPLKSPVLEFL